MQKTIRIFENFLLGICDIYDPFSVFNRKIFFFILDSEWRNKCIGYTVYLYIIHITMYNNT